MEITAGLKRDSRTATFLCQLLLGSLFIALLSQITVPLPFTPVPLSLQTAAILLVGATFGAKKGALTVLTYILEGVIGLPVFAGAACGLAKLLGPTGGYLVGFVVAAFIVGYLIEKGVGKKWSSTSSIMMLGSLIVLILGSFWLAFFVGSKNALQMGFFPFLFGDFLKSLAVAALLSFKGKRLQNLFS